MHMKSVFFFFFLSPSLYQSCFNFLTKGLCHSLFSIWNWSGKKWEMIHLKKTTMMELSLSLWQQFPCTDVWFSHYHIKYPHSFSPESLPTCFPFTPWFYERMFISCCFVSSPGTAEYLPKREEMVSSELHEVLCHQQGWNHQVYIKQVSTGIYRCHWVYKSKYWCYQVSRCVRVSQYIGSQ